MTGSGDSRENSKAHHANNAYGDPSRRNVEQVCSHCDPDDKNDVPDHIHAKRHVDLLLGFKSIGPKLA